LTVGVINLIFVITNEDFINTFVFANVPEVNNSFTFTNIHENGDK